MTRILLVERSATQAAATRLLLEDAGMQVDLAGSRAAALTALQQQPCDLVLAAYSLPDATAAQLCTDIRNGSAADIRVAVLTSSGSVTHILECLAAGADGILIKAQDQSGLPDQLRRLTSRSTSRSTMVQRTVSLRGHTYDLTLDPDQLLDAFINTVEDLAHLHDQYAAVCRQLEQLQQDSGSAAVMTPAAPAAVSSADTAVGEVNQQPTPAPPQPLRILLAEDSSTNQMLGMSLLQNAGHQVTVVADGQQAVDAAQQSEFDLILMDVEMPRMGGLEATRRIRQHESEQNSRDSVRILAMTAQTAAADQQRCRDAGMDGFLQKPLRLKQLQQTLSDLPPADTTPPEQPAASSTGPDLVNWDAALSSVLGDRELLLAVVEAALAECPARLDDVNSALTAGNAVLLHRSAHTIKGLMQTFSAASVSSLAERVEDLAHNDNLTDIPPLLDDLRKGVQQVLSELQRFRNSG